MFSSILASVGLPLLISVLTETLKSIDSPVTKTAAKALKEVDDAIKRGSITSEQMAEANRHAERVLEIKAEDHAITLSEINKSLRDEVASADPYVRRMRPTFGYLMALTWAAQMFALAYIIVFETEKAGVILNAMSSLSAIWAIGLSVLGVYVYKRSEDKKLGAGKEVVFWNDGK